MARWPTRRTLSHSNIQSEKWPEFFKIYLPEHNFRALCIPPAFVKNFNGDIPKKAILKNSLGKIWHVEVENAKSKLLIKKGWEAYVTGQSLERGDFLIFSYSGNAVFTVKVFGINGCKKNETTATNYQSTVKVEQEARMEQVTNHTRVFEQKHPERGIAIQNASRGSRKAVRGIPEISNELSNICFVTVFDRRHYYLPIPRRIIREHNIKAPEVESPETIVLRNQEGVKQSVMLRRRPDRRVEVARGWNDFCLMSRISQGDECQFEIILGKGRRIKEIVMLQISRKKTGTRNISIKRKRR